MWLFPDESNEQIERIAREQRQLTAERNRLIDEIYAQTKPFFEEKEKQLRFYQQKRSNHLTQLIASLLPKEVTLKEVKEHPSFFQVIFYTDDFYLLVSVLKNNNREDGHLFSIQSSLLYFHDRTDLTLAKKWLQAVSQLLRDELMKRKEHRIKAVVEKDYIAIKEPFLRLVRFSTLEKKIYALYLEKKTAAEIANLIAEKEQMVTYTISLIKEKLHN